MVGKKRPGRIVMPSDLKGRGTKNRNSGPVVSYNLHDLDQELSDYFGVHSLHLEGRERTLSDDLDVSNIDSLKALSPEQQRRVLVDQVRKGKSDTEIGEAFGLSQWQVRNLRYKLGIKKDRGGNLRLVEPQVPVRYEASQSSSNSWDDPALILTVNGEFDSASLADRLEGLAQLVRSLPVGTSLNVRLRVIQPSEQDGGQEASDAAS